jgi:universal stress protein A
MYQTILMTLDCTGTDRAIIDHIKSLAKVMRSRVVLLHVATGASAKYHGRNAAGKEVEESQAYLEGVRAEFSGDGVEVELQMAYGDPAREIIHWVQQNKPDLVAMSTHGHHFVADLVLGTTAIRVQHNVSVPVLLLRAR